MRNPECGVQDAAPDPVSRRDLVWVVAADLIPHSEFRIPQSNMPDFTYEALARTGAKSTGTLTASSEREAALILDGRGLFPVKIGLARNQATGGGGGLFAKRVKGRQLSTVYSQLADLLHSG